MLLAACASSVPSREIQIARQVHYDVGIDVIYQAALDAVKARWHAVEGNPATHRVQTAWEQVGSDVTGHSIWQSPDPSRRRDGGIVRNGPATKTFARVAVEIVGERPFEIRVVAHAAQWSPGMAQPSRLTGGDEPPWLTTKADDIRVAIYERLRPYAR